LKISGPKSFVWYGGKSEADPQAVKLTDDVVDAASTIEGTYTFIQTAGNWVDYNDFTQFNLFDPVSNTVIATAQLAAGGPSAGGIVPKPATTPTTGNTKPPSTSKPTTSTPVKEGTQTTNSASSMAAVKIMAVSIVMWFCL
jgi:hypothetical protein